MWKRLSASIVNTYRTNTLHCIRWNILSKFCSVQSVAFVYEHFRNRKTKNYFPLVSLRRHKLRYSCSKKMLWSRGGALTYSLLLFRISVRELKKLTTRTRNLCCYFVHIMLWSGIFSCFFCTRHILFPAKSSHRRHISFQVSSKSA